MPTTRELKITYGTYVIGGTTEVMPTGEWSRSINFLKATVAFSFVVRGDTEATFEDACTAAETAFRERRKLIKVEYGTETHLYYDSSLNTGFNTFATLTKQGTPGGDTGRSRVYSAQIEIDLPPTDAAVAGRQDVTFRLDYDAQEVRRATFTGTWTATPSPVATARANYLANIEAYCASIIAGLASAGTFELVGDQHEEDEPNKIVRFTRVYQELIFNQSISTLNHTSIVSHAVGVSQAIDAPGDSGGGGVKRLQTLTVRFSCGLRKTVSTDLGTLYRDTIRPYMKQIMVDRFDPSSYAITREMPSYDPVSNTLSAEMLILAAIDPTDVIESVLTSRYVEDFGLVFTGVWNGNALAKYADQGHATKRRIGTRAIRVLGAKGPKSRLGGGGSFFGVSFVNPGGGNAAGTGGNGGLEPSDQGGAGGGSGWKMVHNDSSSTVKVIGQVDDEQITVTDIVESVAEEYVEDPGDGGGPDFGVSFSGGSN